MKSGYRIRRSAWPMHHYIAHCNGIIYGSFSSETLMRFTVAELLATDWEIDFTDMIDDSGTEVLYKEPPSDEEE
jgi:hypothetical protein